jgi:putative transposase
MEIFGVEKDVIYSKGRRRIRVAARSLCCCWAARELGLAAAELAKRLKLTQPAVSYAVLRGERIANENSCTLVL